MKYQIQGETLPVVICELEAGERMITEGGAMSWMSPNMKMETTSNGGIGKAFGRAFSGEKMFQNIYTAQGGPGMIAFASSFPGSIRAFEVSSGQDMIFQKSAFLASEAGVQLSMHFRKKLGAGFFGGEGFIMQKVSGEGIVFAEFDGHVIEYELEAGQQIVIDTPSEIFGTALYLADERGYLGGIVISDTIRSDVPEALKGLRSQGVQSLVMLTGDKEDVGKAVAEKLGIDQVYGNLLPGGKVEKVEQLLTQKPFGKTLAFVGDGINDAPVLARADIGIAMGGIGSDAAVEAADVVIMDDEPSKIVDAIQIGKKTMGIVRQNIVFAIGVKVLVLVLVALGYASMWAAVFGDVGVSVLAILNAMRALLYKGKSAH